MHTADPAAGQRGGTSEVRVPAFIPKAAEDAQPGEHPVEHGPAGQQYTGVEQQMRSHCFLTQAEMEGVVWVRELSCYCHACR